MAGCIESNVHADLEHLGSLAGFSPCLAILVDYINPTELYYQMINNKLFSGALDILVDW